MMDFPTRYGRTWDLEDYQRLVELLRDGLDDEEIAHELGRSEGACRSAMGHLLSRPAKGERSPRGAERYALIRESLQDPDFDWLTNVHARHHSARPLWGATMDQALHQAWDAGAPRLPDLASQLDVAEVAVVERMVRTGIAENTTKVVDRLGCTPESTADIRARMSADVTAASV